MFQRLREEVPGRVEEPGQAKRSQDVEEADHGKLTATTEEIRGPKTSSQKVIC